MLGLAGSKTEGCSDMNSIIYKQFSTIISPNFSSILERNNIFRNLLLNLWEKVKFGSV